MKESKKLIILDRDGVINVDSTNYIRSPDEWTPLPGSLEAIAKLSQAGYTLVVATNQSGLARGYFDIAALNAIHKKLLQAVENVNGRIDAIFFCPHAEADGCVCRKPKPGMMLDICTRFDVPPAEVIAIGDSKRDVEAALAAGCRVALVRTGNGLKTLETMPLPESVAVYDDLLDFAGKAVSE